MIKIIYYSSDRINAVMEQLDWKMVQDLFHSKEEWKYAMMVAGKPSVMTAGEPVTRQFFVLN